MQRRVLILAGGALGSGLVLAADTTQEFDAASAATRRVAEPYFAAYIDRDWARLEPLLADNGRFADPTAEPLFGKVEFVGKAAVMHNFRENYASIEHMRFEPDRVFASGTFAVFEGRLDWTLALPNGGRAVTRAMPFLTILRVADGQVVEHLDYADYRPFLEANRKARGGG
jgi:ketosteroid isomerase-like protein